MKKIISLSTIPPRFNAIQPVLKSLLRQTEKLDEIRLYVPRFYRRFPNYDGSLPAFPEGITIVRPDEDLGPATKVLFCARDLQAEDAQILFCDDDCLLYPNWAKRLFDAQRERPNECVALMGAHISEYGFDVSSSPEPRAKINLERRGPTYNIRKIGTTLRQVIDRNTIPKPSKRPASASGYTDVFFGVGGVVIRPKFFDDAFFDIPNVFWTVDDVWLSGRLRMKDIQIWVPKDLPRPYKTGIAFESALVHSVIDGHSRDEADKKCIHHFRDQFGIWN